jgi:hypothetical protein
MLKVQLTASLVSLPISFMVSFTVTKLTDAKIQLTAGLVSLPAESSVPCLLLHCSIVSLLYPWFIGIPVENRYTILIR